MKRAGNAVALATLLFMTVRILLSALPHPAAAPLSALLAVLLSGGLLSLLGELRGARDMLRLPRRDALPLLALLPLFVSLTALASIPSALLADLIGMNRTVEPSGALPLLLLTSALVPALAEELFCRFLCLYPFGSGKSAAVWLSAILFAALHLNLAQLPYAFGAGLLLGALVSLGGSVLLPILFHLVNNAASLLLWRFNADSPLVFAAIGLIGLLPLALPAVRRAARALLSRIALGQAARRELCEAILSPYSLPILACLLLSLL